MVIVRRCVGLALAAISILVSTAGAADQRLFYEITVTAPGTRSQGWHGALYDPQGHQVAATPEQRWLTNAGAFVNVECAQAWVPCGVIHADQMAWMSSHGGNVILDRGAWTYRLVVTAPCSRSEGWRGELLHNGVPVRARASRKATPMGPFLHKASPYLWGQKGWSPVSWPAAVIAPGRWPCDEPR